MSNIAGYADRFDSAQTIADRSKSTLKNAYQISSFAESMYKMVPVFTEEFDSLERRIQQGNLSDKTEGFFRKKMIALSHAFHAAKDLYELYALSGKYNSDV